jgi:hypothetical protein
MEKKNIILFILAIGFIVRIGFMIFFCDTNRDFYWEFGNIAKNLHAGNGYSLYYFSNDSLKHDFNPIAKPYPSAFMPPAYVYYIYPFLNIENVKIRNVTLLISQIILSLLVIYCIYLFSSKYFSERIGLISAAIAALLPEFIFSSVTYNAVIHYHILIILSLFLVMDKGFYANNTKISLFLLLSCFILYFRSEYFIFISFVFLFFIFKKQYKLAFAGSVIILILYSPWVIRNYIVFDKFVPFTTSFGLNFYRGHNPEAIGDWGSIEFVREIRDKSTGDNFEIVYNDSYFKKAMESVNADYSIEVKNIFIKVFNLFIINPDDARSFNPVYLISSLSMLLLALMGIIKTFSFEKYKYMYLFIFYSILIASIFFAIPRYQTMMKIAIIPFAAFTVDLLIQYFCKPAFNKSSDSINNV